MKYFWILYFDVECMNEIDEYEAPGLKRVVELNVKDLKILGNSTKNPFQQKLGEIHPKLEPLIQKEMRKLGFVFK